MVNYGIFGTTPSLGLRSVRCGLFVMNDIDDERAGLFRSLAWRGPYSPA